MRKTLKNTVSQERVCVGQVGLEVPVRSPGTPERTREMGQAIHEGSRPGPSLRHCQGAAGSEPLQAQWGGGLTAQGEEALPGPGRFRRLCGGRWIRAGLKPEAAGPSCSAVQQAKEITLLARGGKTGNERCNSGTGRVSLTSSF